MSRRSEAVIMAVNEDKEAERHRSIQMKFYELLCEIHEVDKKAPPYPDIYVTAEWNNATEEFDVTVSMGETH